MTGCILNRKIELMKSTSGLRALIVSGNTWHTLRMRRMVRPIAANSGGVLIKLLDEVDRNAVCKYSSSGSILLPFHGCHVSHAKLQLATFGPEKHKFGVH